ncbi:MAG: UbiA family prenyltransferase [Bacteroidota bacterium]
MYNAGFKDILTLIRLPVTIAVTFTAFTAMFMVKGDFQAGTLWSVAGIFLLAAGASAFNQYQEWPYDELMDRTRRRPIPSRRISPAEGLRIALIGIAGGLVILMYESTGLCLILGVFNLIWYNGVYTPLKRITAFAVVPGALTGVIPIFMGWTAAGGSLLAPEVLFLAFFLFIWQMPHFWLLTLKYGHEYRAAGFPVLTDFFNEVQVKMVVMGWMIASSAASYMLIYFKILHLPVLGYALIGLNITLLLLLAYQLFIAAAIRYRLIFIAANLFMMIVMLSLIADKLIIPIH